MRVNKYNKVQTDETNMRRIAIYLLCIFMLLPVATMTAQPGYNYSKLQREKLKPRRSCHSRKPFRSNRFVEVSFFRSDTDRFQCVQRRKKLTDTPITASAPLFRDKNNSQKNGCLRSTSCSKRQETHHIDGTYTPPKTRLGYLEIPCKTGGRNNSGR